ncbi:MAG TPA: ABC transporter substrate-binding protein [Rhizobiaceae bacterium]|nr:ABC transporter substrate-binding protein [Rhizobiaceae bacterium]
MEHSINRRSVIKTAAAGVAASALPLPAFIRAAQAADPIVIGLLATTSSVAGVADHLDHTQGATLAMEEINAAGGVGGRMIELMPVDLDILSPESCVAAVGRLVDAKVHAISTAFTLAPIPTQEATAKYGCPLLWGPTQRAVTELTASDPQKFGHCFQVDPSEVHYGYTLPIFLKDMRDRGLWTPINNKIHIVQEQLAYNQTISKAAIEAIEKHGEFEIAAITDIQFPVQDWAPVIQEIKRVGAGMVMINHWVAAEYAAFCKQYIADPSPNTLVYLQYGPSQPEFLDLAGPAADGFVWSSVLGVYADEMGNEFRKKYQERFPGTMGLTYTGSAYDTLYLLKRAWEAVGDPNNFKEVSNHIRTNGYRGVCGYYDMNNKFQECVHYPDNGYEIGTNELEKGMAQLYVQVQDGAHKIIYPDAIKETDLIKASW